MYWFTFVSVLFLSIIQGFIFRDNQCPRFFPCLMERSSSLYSKKFPWLDSIDGDGNDGDGNDGDENDNSGTNRDVIIWGDENDMHSLDGHKYKSSDLPENDLVELTGQQVNIIAKSWYTHVLSELFDKTNETDNLKKMGKLKKQRSSTCLFHNMNKLERTYHKKESYKYYVWIPDKENFEKESDILACFSVKETSENISLFSLLIHPMWTSDNISLKKLKNSIDALTIENKSIDVSNFYEDEKNERIVLEWVLG